MAVEVNKNNKVYINGEIVSEPKISHELYGEKFYKFFVEIKRLSGTFDVIPVTLSERLIDVNTLKKGNVICGLGQLRTHNKIENEKSKLFLTVFLREIFEESNGKNPNNICLLGTICKEPIYRETPLAREITDLLVAVNRPYGKSDYIPCIAWGRNARFSKDFQVGDKISIVGRIQSREYQKTFGPEIKKLQAYEVSITRLAKVEEGQEYDIDSDFELYSIPRPPRTENVNDL
jgi:single-stranded DNA-binding protein